MKKFFYVAVVALALTACGKAEKEVTNATDIVPAAATEVLPAAGTMSVALVTSFSA